MWCIWVFEEFWVTQNLGQSMLVTTPYCQWLLPLTNYGDQFQQWTLFMLKQYCLEGILAKESSPRTKDFLLWRDLQIGKAILKADMYIRENGLCTTFLFQGRNTKSQGDEERLFLDVFLWFKFTFNHATIQDCKRIPVALNETLKRCRDIASRPRIGEDVTPWF